MILLPEVDYEVDAVIALCKAREARQRYTVICMAEGAKARGGQLTVKERIADSPDPVRLGGVGHVLREQIQPHLGSEVRTTVLGHVQAGWPGRRPSTGSWPRSTATTRHRWWRAGSSAAWSRCSAAN